MANYRGKPCRIVWGPGSSQVLYLGDLLDEANAYSLPRSGYETVQYGSGVEDAWAPSSDDYYLAGVARYIPQTDALTANGRSVTGWDGAAGFDAMLRWARQKNVLRFDPDYVGAPGVLFSGYLVEQSPAAPEREDDTRFRRVPLLLRSANGIPFDGY